MNIELNPSACLSPESSGTDSAPGCWQQEFLKLLPAIERGVRIAFRHLDGDHRDEAVQESICHCCQAYARLHLRGRVAAANPTSLVRYAVAHYRVGRRVGHSMNIKDVMSAYCRYRKGVRVESVNSGSRPLADWQEVLVENRHVTPADLAASRIDYPAWLSTLGGFRRRIAELLASGERTMKVARICQISPSRVSQLRQELMDAWEAFHAPKPMAIAEP